MIYKSILLSQLPTPLFFFFFFQIHIRLCFSRFWYRISNALKFYPKVPIMHLLLFFSNKISIHYLPSITHFSIIIFYPIQHSLSSFYFTLSSLLTQFPIHNQASITFISKILSYQIIQNLHSHTYKKSIPIHIQNRNTSFTIHHHLLGFKIHSNT